MKLFVPQIINEFVINIFLYVAQQFLSNTYSDKRVIALFVSISGGGGQRKEKLEKWVRGMGGWMGGG